MAGILAAFIACGALLWIAHRPGMLSDPLAQWLTDRPDTGCAIEGRVHSLDLIVGDTDYGSFVLRVDRVISGEETLPLRGRAEVRWTDPRDPPLAGERVRIQGKASLAIGRINPGVSGREDTLRRHGVHSILYARGPDAVTRLAPAPWYAPQYWASRIRRAEAAWLESVAPGSVAPFVRAVWLGDRRGIDPAAYEAYVASGTAHVLAVSGIHVGIFAMSLLFALGLVLRNGALCAILVQAGTILFALSTGAHPSSMRAAAMVVVYLTADLLGRERDAPTALSIAAILFMVWNPALLYDTGSQLSFLSVASILLFAEPLLASAEGVPAPVRGLLATPVAVQILPLPVAVHTFHVLPLAAPLANLLVVPLLTAVLWLCLATFSMAALWPDAARLFGYALAPAVSAIEWVARATASVPGGHWTVTSPSPLSLALYYGAAASLYGGLILRRKRAFLLALSVLLAVATLVFWGPIRHEPEIVFLDLGEGDSAFVRAPSGATLLIDGGYARRGEPGAGERYVAPFLLARGVRRLDCVIVSHGDNDHIGGLVYIARTFDIGEVLISDAPAETEIHQEFLNLCAERAIPVRHVACGDCISAGGMAVEVLHPPRAWAQSVPRNESSLVVRVDWCGVPVLFPGDIERMGETALAGTDCRATILKVPHHGSITSSSPGFIAAVQPEHVIVPAGERGRGAHLDPIVAARYTAAGATLWRTDHHGAVRITLDDGHLDITAERARRGYPVYEGATANHESGHR